MEQNLAPNKVTQESLTNLTVAKALRNPNSQSRDKVSFFKYQPMYSEPTFEGLPLDLQRRHARPVFTLKRPLVKSPKLKRQLILIWAQILVLIFQIIKAFKACRWAGEACFSHFDCRLAPIGGAHSLDATLLRAGCSFATRTARASELAGRALGVCCRASLMKPFGASTGNGTSLCCECLACPRLIARHYFEWSEEVACSATLQAPSARSLSFAQFLVALC